MLMRRLTFHGHIYNLVWRAFVHKGFEKCPCGLMKETNDLIGSFNPDKRATEKFEVSCKAMPAVYVILEA